MRRETVSATFDESRRLFFDESVAEITGLNELEDSCSLDNRSLVIGSEGMCGLALRKR